MEVRFFHVVLGLRRMKKIFELGQKFFYFFFHLRTLYMSSKPIIVANFVTFILAGTILYFKIKYD